MASRLMDDTNVLPSSRRPTQIRFLAPCVILFFVHLIGCHHGAYSPESLPPHLAATPAIDLGQLDLSRMVGPGVHNDVIFPGDTVEVSMVTGAEQEHPQPWVLRVSDDGAIDVPLVGPVHVAGLPVLSAERAIRAASIEQRVFRKPVVRVAIRQRRANRVTVVGAVNGPGTYELPAAASTLAAALVAAGGLSEKADRLVDIHQSADQTTRATATAADDGAVTGLASYHRKLPGEMQTVQIDLLQASRRADGAYYLADGATVNVRPQPDRIIHLMGLTGNRTLDLPPHRNVRVLDALAEAGGPKYSLWIADKVKVIRPVPGSDQTATIVVSIRQAKRDGAANILLASGDIVSVEENVATFTLGTLGQLIGIGTTAATGAATGVLR